MQNLKFDPTSYDFGGVGDTSAVWRDFTFYLKNYSTQPTSGSVAVYGDYPFSCVSGCSYDLGYYESQSVTIRFNPVTQESFNATIYAGNTSASVSGYGIDF